MSGPTVAVIGAGISGLTMSKMLEDYGLEYATFESSDRVGGNWAFGNPNGHSSAYRSLHIDTSKHRLSFKDFPMPDDYPDFPHHTQIKAYLDAYADAFGLRERIEFENGIQHARRLDGGGWELRTQAGETMHSHHYIDPTEPLDLKGKRILVVGLGNSAADIAVELSSKSLQNTVTVSTRSSAWIVPKYVYGLPADKYFVTSPHIPLHWQRWLIQKMQFMTGSNPELYGLPAPNHKFFEAHPTQSVELPLRLGSGDITPKSNVTLLDGSTVHFEDGTSDDFDVIVYATGYNITFPFFDPDFLSAPDNRLRLFKRMFKPGLDDLVFMGFAQATPTLFPFVESQARLLGAYAVGRYRLPDVDEMERVIDADQQKFTGHVLDRPRHTQQLDYFVYEHDLRTKEIPAGLQRAQGVAR